MSTTYAAKFEARSGIGRASSTAMSVGLATNQLREPTFFEGELRDPLRLREALGALHAVVVSDFRFKPKPLADRAEFVAWLAGQDKAFLENINGAGKAARVAELTESLAQLDLKRNERRAAFITAKARYFNEVAWRNSYELWYLLDPVVTVAPDEVSFEAFSRDESTYARLSVSQDLFDGSPDRQFGTTNIDFSVKLHEQLQRLRTYRTTRFGVKPSGFSVQTTGAGIDGDHLEKKIDLPDSWVNGFLQVHATMSLGLTRLRLRGIDLFNLVRTLRRLGRARKSPRAIRWELTPGQPGRVVLEPWEHAVEFSTRYHGPEPTTIRTWGRDRLRTIERLLPMMTGVDVFLAGTGMPSLYVLRLGPGVTFTLGLSGWTDNDWTGDDQFSLLARPKDCTATELMSAYTALREHRRMDEPGLSAATGLDVHKARAAVNALCAVGRATADLGSIGNDESAGMIYRHRDLFAGPFDEKAARRATDAGATPKGKIGGDRQRIAEQIVAAGNVRIIAKRPVQVGGDTTWKISGNVRGPDGRSYRPLVHINAEGKVLEFSCTCRHFKEHRLTQGPCEHVLALRQYHLNQS
ncbi:MAG: SWIM zinc finger family protein [Planctomycetota bacterium]